MLSVGTIRFEDRSASSRNSGIADGVSVWPSEWQHMADVAVKRPCSALDRVFLFVSQMSINPHLVGTPFFGTVGSFQSGWEFAGWRALAIESLLNSRCGQGHGPVKCAWMFHWVKFPILAPSRIWYIKEGIHGQTSREENSVVNQLQHKSLKWTAARNLTVIRKEYPVVQQINTKY